MSDVVNLHEKAAYLAVRRVAAADGASVHLNTKLSDVADPARAPREFFQWATRAHVDLLVRDADTLAPLFAVEIDGQQHETDPQQAARDRVKDALLERAGIGVLRVTTGTVLHRHGRDRLAAYLADLWFASRAYYDAQERGAAPMDEGFFHHFTYRVNGDTGRLESLDPTAGIRARLWRDYSAGIGPAEPVPAHFHRYEETTARVESLVVLPLTADTFVSARAKIGKFRITGVLPSDVAEEVALLELDWLYRRWRRGEAVARRVRDLDAVLPARCASSSSTGDWCTNGMYSGTAKWITEVLGEERTQAFYGHFAIGTNTD